MTNRLPRRLACTLVISAAAAAQGDVITFVASMGEWHNELNWSPQQVPTEADRVVIPDGKWCQIENDDAFADTIVVEEGGILEIMSGMVLTLDNDDDNISPSGTDHSIVDGEVRIEYDPDPAVLFFAERSHIVRGDGVIRGVDTAAEIRIAAGIRLQSELADTAGGVRGGLTIRGLASSGLTNGMFRNYGRVHAVTTILCHEDTMLEDTDGAVWTLQRCPARIRFDREALTLEGDFEITASGGAFVFNEDVTTCGELIYNQTGLLFGNGAVFRYASYSGSEPNPGDCKVPSSCLAPCEASSNETPCFE